MKRPLICTPVQAETQEEALEQLHALHENPKVDMAELWLDKMRNGDIKTILEKVEIPVLCVNKLPADGGSFNGTEQMLVTQLFDAARHGAWGISIPTERLSGKILENIRLNLEQLFALTGKRVNFAGEHHYWPPKEESSVNESPPNFEELRSVAERMYTLGVDSAKVVTYAETPADTAVTLALSNYLQAKGRKSTTLAMGEHGAATRLNPYNEMMFAPVDPAQATAPGQYTVDQLHKIFEERFGLK